MSHKTAILAAASIAAATLALSATACTDSSATAPESPANPPVVSSLAISPALDDIETRLIGSSTNAGAVAVIRAAITNGNTSEALLAIGALRSSLEQARAGTPDADADAIALHLMAIEAILDGGRRSTK